ncbi:MAG TPA: hypothetical protein VGK73_25170 [Polyangiaceae bacterium]
MTTPTDPDTRIAELKANRAVVSMNVGGLRSVADEAIALASELAEKLRNVTSSFEAGVRVCLSLAKELAEAKREIEQERELRSAALAYLHNLETMWEGYEGTASPGERRTVLTILNKTCIALGDTAPHSPTNPESPTQPADRGGEGEGGGATHRDRRTSPRSDL